jgi:segregation and condensation protein B
VSNGTSGSPPVEEPPVDDSPVPEAPVDDPGALFAAPEPARLDREQLCAALEAVLLVVDEPVTESALAEVVEAPADRVVEALTALSAEYTETGRGFDLRRAAGGWRLYTRPEQARYVERFVLNGQQARLTQAALETLAVIAYRQPVTRSRISAIRGVNCDGVVRTLMTRGLVDESGTEPETGAYLYRTTGTFLEKLGLDSLEQLPPLAPFLPDDFEALNPDAAAGERDLPAAGERDLPAAGERDLPAAGPGEPEEADRAGQ